MDPGPSRRGQPARNDYYHSLSLSLLLLLLLVVVVIIIVFLVVITITVTIIVIIIIISIITIIFNCYPGPSRRGRPGRHSGTQSYRFNLQ